MVIHQPLRNQLYTRTDQKRLDALGNVVWTEETQPLSMDAAIEVLHDCEIGVGSWGSPAPSPEMLKACPKLKL